MKKKNKDPKIKEAPAEYDLCDVRNLIDQQKFLIRENAESSALNDFGWDIEDIKSAIKKLKSKHFHKSAYHDGRPGVKIDYYKARGIKKENIYTHFYIDDSTGYLIISSFKRI